MCTVEELVSSATVLLLTQVELCGCIVSTIGVPFFRYGESIELENV